MPLLNGTCQAINHKRYIVWCMSPTKWSPWANARMDLALPLVDLYLISENSSWKNQVWQTGFLVYFLLNFHCLFSIQISISKLIFAGYTGMVYVNSVWKRLKIYFVELDFSKLIFQKSSIDQQGEIWVLSQAKVTISVLWPLFTTKGSFTNYVYKTR